MMQFLVGNYHIRHKGYLLEFEGIVNNRRYSMTYVGDDLVIDYPLSDKNKELLQNRLKELFGLGQYKRRDINKILKNNNNIIDI